MQREADSREGNNYKAGSIRIRKEGDTFFTLTRPSSSNPFIPPLIPQLPPQSNFGLWDLVHLHSTLDMLLQSPDHMFICTELVGLYTYYLFTQLIPHHFLLSFYHSSNSTIRTKGNEI